MESILLKEDGEQPNYGFVPMTPDKTLNCPLNCAITSVENSGITSPSIRYDSGKDIDSISPTLIGSNVWLNGGVSFPSISMATTTAATLNMSRAVGLKRASCSNAVGSDNVNQSGVVPDADNKDDEVMTQQKNKKQKVGPDLNRKPGEKRQNKYYWAKIDVPKPYTPALRTPKVVTEKRPKSKTPKPSKPKTTPKVVTPKSRRKNDKKRPIECLEISKHVGVGEPVIGCKRSLNFEAGMPTDLELEPDNVPKVVETVYDKTTKNTMCTKGINLGDGDINMIKVKPNIKLEEKKVIVYRRKFNSKCLYICRNLLPKFQENFKRKRLQRNKKSFGALKRFEGFNRSCLMGGLLDRMLSVKGKLRMLLPTNVDFPQDSFKCVLSLLSSRPVFTIKKRLPRARRSTKLLVHQDETTPREPLSHVDLIVLPRVNDNVPLCTKQFQITSTPSKGRKPKVIKEKTSKRTYKPKGKQLIISSTPSKGRKPNVIKEKTSKRTYKPKGEQYDFLEKLSDWRDASVEVIMDEFARLFRSIKINDDPKTWIVEVSDQDNTSDSYYEEIRLEEERTNLLKKIGKFLHEMSYYQGSKEFLKWNGSVLDSVVGVFLTQNVSDILSSNAFLNLASKYPIKPPTNSDTVVDHMDSSSQGSSETVSSSQKVIVEHPDDEEETTPDPIVEEPWTTDKKAQEEYDAALKVMLAAMPYLLESKKKGKPIEGIHIDWEKIRVRFSRKSQRKPENEDSVDWEAVRKTDHRNIAKVIRRRGQQYIIAKKIKEVLNRLVDDHGSLDVEWLRDAPPHVAKAYLLSFYGLGLKSVECLRLLTLHHHGFPVDVNISRIAIRLGWVPIKPLPPGMPFHLLQKYPLEDQIQKYLWPRLGHLKQETLYHLHYQMITFGKVFCQKRSPNCRACPFKSDCRYYASLTESWRQALPGPTDRKRKKSKKHENTQNPFDRIIRRPSGPLPFLTSNISSCSEICVSSLDAASSSQLATRFGNVSQKPMYFVDVPLSPKAEVVEEEEEGRVGNAELVDLIDIEDCCDGYMYHLKLNSEENKRASLHYYQKSNISGQNSASREMISVPENDAFNRLPKQVNVARLRTEHQVYELPKDHQLLTHLNMETQIGAVPYLLAIWTPDQLEKTCDNTEGGPCSSEGECTSRDDASTIPGTLLLPVQTALKRYFPLNGTYFQMNEVFVDYETCERPFKVPTNWIWNLRKRTVYCGSGVSAVVKGTTEMEIRQLFSEGFICMRGFNRKTRAPEALPSRFHRRPKGKSQPENKEEDEEEDEE